MAAIILDANSRLTNRWSKAKGNSAYLYDSVGSLTKVDYPSGTTDITLQYDALNRVTNMVDAAGTTNPVVGGAERGTELPTSVPTRKAPTISVDVGLPRPTRRN